MPPQADPAGLPHHQEPYRRWSELRTLPVRKGGKPHCPSGRRRRISSCRHFRASNRRMTAPTSCRFCRPKCHTCNSEVPCRSSHPYMNRPTHRTFRTCCRRLPERHGWTGRHYPQTAALCCRHRGCAGKGDSYRQPPEKRLTDGRLLSYLLFRLKARHSGRPV